MPIILQMQKYVYQDLQEENFYEKVKKNLSEHLANDDDIIEVEEEFEDENVMMKVKIIRIIMMMELMNT